MIGGPGPVKQLVAVGREVGVGEDEFSESDPAVEITLFAKIASIIAQPCLITLSRQVEDFLHDQRRGRCQVHILQQMDNSPISTFAII